MFNRKLLFLVGALVGSLIVTASCTSKKNDNNKKLALLYLFEQTTGNCATISKITGGSSGTYYQATATGIPRGGCNSATLDTNIYTTSSSTAAGYVGAYYGQIKNLLTSSNCSAFETVANTEYNTYSSNTGQTTLSTQASSATSGCYVTGGYQIVSSSSRYAYVVLCKDQTSLDTYKSNVQYQPISDALTDMATYTKYAKAYLKGTTGSATYNFTSTAVDNIRVESSSEVALQAKDYYNAVAFVSNSTVISSVATKASISTSAATTLAAKCNQDLFGKDSATKAFYLDMYGTQNAAYGFSTSDAQGVSSVIFTPYCKYGAGFTETASSNQTTIDGTTYTTYGTCPSSYPQF